MAYQQTFITGVSGALQTQITAAGTARTPILNVTGNFTITGLGQWGYSWNGGAGVYGTGTIASPLVLSGYQITVKNRSTAGYLLVSGNIDYDTNYTVTPLSAVCLWADGTSWLTI